MPEIPPRPGRLVAVPRDRRRCGSCIRGVRYRRTDCSYPCIGAVGPPDHRTTALHGNQHAAHRDLDLCKQAIAESEGLRGERARPVRAPMLCLCRRRHQNGMAARTLPARCDSGRRGYRHLTFTHWHGSPFPLARFPPPSLTPSTASMPRSSLPTARFLTSFVELLSTSKPSSPDRFARFEAKRTPTVHPARQAAVGGPWENPQIAGIGISGC